MGVTNLHKMVRSAYFCVMVVVTLIPTVYSTEFNWKKYMPAGNNEPVVEYVYFSQPATWNDARSTCTEMGGDLAKLDSEEIIEVVLQSANETYGAGLLDRDFWIGLTEKTFGLAMWASDCTNVSYTGNYESSDSWQSGQMCFYTGNDLQGYRSTCNTTLPFLCERLIDDRCQSLLYLYDMRASKLLVADVNECDQSCTQDIYCVASLYVHGYRCYVLYDLVTSISASLYNVTMKAKSCIRVSLNETYIPTVSNSDLTPNISCYTGPDTQDSTVNPTSSDTSAQSVLTSEPAPTTTQSLATTSYSEQPTEEPTTTATQSATSSINVATETATSSVLSPSCLGQNTASTVTLETESGTPYVCHVVEDNANLTASQIEEKANEISENLTIQAKTTSAYFRKLTSAEDKRTASVVMGTVGVICIITPVVILLLSDMKLVYRYYLKRCKQR